MLKAKNIHKSYHELHVLNGIDIEVNQGEIVSIVGASGAGKSTLLHILGLLDHPNQGQVILNEKNVLTMRGNKLAHFRNQHIGFIFQFHNLLPEFSALENVCIPGYLGNGKSKNVENKAKDLLSFLGLNDRINHKPSDMSGGELQRTAVARALINDPSIVFADEPSGNLDSKNAKDLHQLFFRLRDKLTQTFVIVTHNRKLAAMADRQLEIKDGKIV
ncbi:MAG: ABC transporter ATP-binding protein [Cytophagales bacterium]|nr:ABC transporter ATP-binding protein [Cytophagales bacterium]